MNKKYKELTPEEREVIVNKETEKPFSGKYLSHKGKGVYVCKRCGAELYRSEDKFDSGCGWPSFDDEIPGAIKRIPDKDGQRTEIVCAKCGAHLGHVFEGEKMTPKNIRHCVNSISLDFKKSKETEKNSETAYFAGGCFWGIEAYFQKQKGVISTQAGYMGGDKENPTYKEVSSQKTGHAETVKVVFDPSKISFEELAKVFFEIHDPTQVNRQGPDTGSQYRSAIFYTSPEQEQTVKKLIALLEKKGLQIATQVVKAGVFWPAEDYHQKYYLKQGKENICLVREKRF